MPTDTTPASVSVDTTTWAPVGVVAAADNLAASAGIAALRADGTAVDAAVAAGAVLVVTNQHQCGLGGDLFALVHQPGQPVAALCAAGRAGSGADAAGPRREGLDRLPLHGDVRAVTVPGCVDGWMAAARPLRPHAARTGPRAGDRLRRPWVPASRLLAYSATDILRLDGADDYRAAVADGTRLTPGTPVHRPGVAAAPDAIASGGRDAFYLAPFGEGLVELGGGVFAPEDLARPQADWVTPLQVTAWGNDVWTTPRPLAGVPHTRRRLDAGDAAADHREALTAATTGRPPWKSASRCWPEPSRR